jgi:hypothetical protein
MKKLINKLKQIIIILMLKDNKYKNNKIGKIQIY